MTKLYEEHADLYDLAFDWDVSDEVHWLIARPNRVWREPSGTRYHDEAVNRSRSDLPAGLDAALSAVHVRRIRQRPRRVQQTEREMERCRR
jgi:hypothetical protein